MGRAEKKNDMETADVKDFSPNVLNRRLEEQYTEIAQLAGGLAHEVKNPLSTIRLNMALLKEDVEDLEDTPQRRRVLARIATVERETLRLEDLLNEFLNFTRAHRLELTPVDANQELKQIVSFFRPQAEAEKVELQEFYSNDLPTIRIDKRSFDRAILNLLLNALQAIQIKRLDDEEANGGAEILVRTRPCGGEVAIDLIDSGCGMQDDVMRKIFEPFFSTKPGGSGLGLPTVRKVIEGHGGRIAIQSDLGRGTQFTLTFPAIPSLLSDKREKEPKETTPDETPKDAVAEEETR